MKFKIKSFMVPTVKVNFMNDKNYASDNYKCWDCEYVDTQRHIENCESYEDYRKDIDLNDDSDLVTYFQRVIAHRLEKLDK